MDPIKQFGLLCIAVLVTAAITWWAVPEKIIYSTEYQQEQIDSLTVEIRNSHITRDALQDSLQSVTDVFRQRLDRRGEEVATYARITGDLMAERDSLEEVASVALNDLVERHPADSTRAATYTDTTLTNRSTFGNGLIEAVARGGIRMDSLFVDPPNIRMLRPIQLDVAVTITDNRDAVHTIVTSRDLSNLRVEAFTEITPKKRFPWAVVGLGVGFVAGVLLE